MSELTKLRKPEIVNGAIFIPVLADDDNRSLNYVLSFLITKKGVPSREPVVAYRDAGLKDPFPSIKQKAWNQAYAVLMAIAEKNRETPQEVPVARP